MEPSIVRYENRDTLIKSVAALLCSRMSSHQQRFGTVSLCLTGGDVANAVYDEVAQLVSADPTIALDQVNLWWNWDFFVAIDDPRRNSLQVLSHLAGALPFDSAKVHPIPSSSTDSDPEAAAISYNVEVADADIDVCLVEMTPSGQIAGLLPHHTHFSPSPDLVAAITDIDPPRMTMTKAGLNTAKEIWILASGAASAECVAQATQGDLTLPASHLTGTIRATWMVDQEAASLLPFHDCRL